MLQGTKCKRKFYTFFTAWCLVFVMTVGMLSGMGITTAYAAKKSKKKAQVKKCACGVKNCKLDCVPYADAYGVSMPMCQGISINHKYSEKNKEHKGEIKEVESKVSCTKHPKLAAQGVCSITYVCRKGKWNVPMTIVFADGSSILSDSTVKTYQLEEPKKGSSYARTYAEKHKSINSKIGTVNSGDTLTTGVTGGVQTTGKDSGASSSTDSSTCESRFKDAYFDWEIPYSKKMSDLFDFSGINKNCSEKGLEKKESKTVASAIFFNHSEGDSCLAPTKALAKNINGVKYTGSFSKEKINGKECEVYTASDGSKYVVVNMPSDMLKWGESANDKSKAVRKHTNGLFMDFIAKDGTTVHGVQFSIAINTKELHYERDGYSVKAADACKTRHTSSAGTSNLVSEVKKQDWDVFHCWVMTSANHPTIKQGISLQGGSYSTADWFKAQGFTTDDKNPLVTVRYYTTRDTADNPAKATSTDIVTKGTAPSTNNTDSKGNGTESTLQMNGFYTEAQLSSYTKLVEPELTDQVANSDKSVLTQEETEGLSDWQMNVERSKEHKGIATLINYILTVIGVLLIIWGSIFYMAYWFDMINPFVDLDLVSRLSFGRFTASHELDGSCTWSLTKHKEGRGTRQQTINSKVALFISVCAIAIGVLIISGGLYRIVRSVFYGGAVLFHQMFG